VGGYLWTPFHCHRLQPVHFADSEEDDNHHSSPEASPSIPALVPANDEVGQRIKGAPTRRHIPRQNSEHWSKEPSSSADDRQRLLDNLKLYQLVEKEVKGDGNCQVTGSPALVIRVCL
jgi:hypothetical protein